MDIARFGDLVLETGRLGSALWSPDRRHRYWLSRPLAAKGIRLAVAMQNPSAAGPDENDPTVIRVCGFARALGAAEVEVVNMGAGVATDPADFLRMPDPIGERNYDVLLESARGADLYVAAWGALSPRLRRLFRLSLGIVRRFRGLKCWGKTKGGDPRHPLYLPGDVGLVDFV